nr:hypothetical protein DA06_11000 [Georgenia sp. SUBG003]
MSGGVMVAPNRSLSAALTLRSISWRFFFHGATYRAVRFAWLACLRPEPGIQRSWAGGSENRRKSSAWRSFGVGCVRVDRRAGEEEGVVLASLEGVVDGLHDHLGLTEQADAVLERVGVVVGERDDELRLVDEGLVLLGGAAASGC